MAEFNRMSREENPTWKEKNVVQDWTAGNTKLDEEEERNGSGKTPSWGAVAKDSPWGTRATHRSLDGSVMMPANAGSATHRSLDSSISMPANGPQATHNSLDGSITMPANYVDPMDKVIYGSMPQNGIEVEPGTDPLEPPIEPTPIQPTGQNSWTNTGAPMSGMPMTGLGLAPTSINIPAAPQKWNDPVNMVSAATMQDMTNNWNADASTMNFPLADTRDTKNLLNANQPQHPLGSGMSPDVYMDSQERLKKQQAELIMGLQELYRPPSSKQTLPKKPNTPLPLKTWYGYGGGGGGGGGSPYQRWQAALGNMNWKI